jgi:hypothetical protein
MDQHCTRTLKEIKLLYTGDKLEAMLTAWDMYPTFKKDCRMTRELKAKARESRMNKILAAKPLT